jgi:uncharacterized phage protein (TIGR02220 family)
MSVVDDFGRFSANPKLLRASCFPLRLDTVSDADVTGWLQDCIKAGLVAAYEVNGKHYLELEDFRQQVRAKASKFPDPLAHAKQPLAVVKQLPESAHLDVDVDVDVVMSGKPDESRQVLEYLNEQTGHSYKPVESNLKLVRARLAEGSTVEECRAVIDAKVSEWASDAKMAQYLRPDTLFNATKFAQYSGQLGSTTEPIFREKYL